MPLLKTDWTVDDLVELPDDGNRYEVIDGELLVTPAPRILHQVAIQELLALLSPFVTEQQLGLVLGLAVDVRFSPRRGVQPDLLILPFVNGRRPKSFADVGRLVLAVEVISPATARADRVMKRALYREEGVPEYWIVDCDSRTIERSTPADDRMEIVADTLVWSPAGATRQLELDVAAYFAAVVDG